MSGLFFFSESLSMWTCEAQFSLRTRTPPLCTLFSHVAFYLGADYKKVWGLRVVTGGDTIYPHIHILQHSDVK